jgi:hypothetical protein
MARGPWRSGRPAGGVTRPTWRQGSVGAWSRGGSGQSYSSICHRRGGSGTAARASRWGGGLVWGTSKRIDSPERALGGGGGSVEGLTGARLEERRVAPVVRLVGTGASWWSLRTERRHRTRTRGGRRQEVPQRRQNPTTPDVDLLLWPMKEEER